MKVNPRKEPRYPIFHIPHDGWRFPDELMAGVCIPREEFLAYHAAMRDQDVRKMVPDCCTGDMRQVFEISRLLCDVERFIGPEEIMEQYGMGFCYEKAYDGRIIKRVTDKIRAGTRRYYDAHHRAMNRLCEEHPCVILFDLHSYTDEIIPPFARASGRETPDLCMGTDARFTPHWFRELVEKRFGEAGLSTAENEPYSGCYIPEDVMNGKSNCDFIGIMLEFNRRAYCDEQGETDPKRIKAIQDILQQVIVECNERVH